MAVKPKIVTLTNSSVQVLNAIRNSSTVNYRSKVPIATPDADSIKKIGSVIMDYPELQNEFVSALINRIARVIVTSKTYDNPWSMFKKGLMEFGESIEEVFVELTKVYQYDPVVAESTVFKREKPDIRSAFHVMNYQKFYKSTINDDQLRTAFLSWEGVTDLIAKIVEKMYTSSNYDEFQVMKYMVARYILDGLVKGASIPAIETKENVEDVAEVMRSVSNKFEFMSENYNLAGVHNHCNKADQYIIINADFEAKMSVKVLASAFNISYADYPAKRVLVDGFGELDTKRLGEIFADDPTYTPLTEAELKAVNAVPGMLVDKDWFQIYDNLMKFTEIYNNEGLGWNYTYHVWKTFSISPFSNACLFIPEIQSVTEIGVAPNTATVTAGQGIQLSATVDTTGFASKSVKWSVPDDTVGVTVSDTGYVSTAKESTGDVVVTVTSLFDDTITAESTITIA